jgi:hypothetical protein
LNSRQVAMFCSGVVMSHPSPCLMDEPRPYDTV